MRTPSVKQNNVFSPSRAVPICRPHNNGNRTPTRCGGNTRPRPTRGEALHVLAGSKTNARWSVATALAQTLCIISKYNDKGLVAACWSIKPVCTRPWPSLRPVRPPRALTVDKSWVWPVFDACVGVCRVSGVHGLNVPLPLCPPHAHSDHGVYLQSMDPPPPPPSSAGPPDNHDERVSGTHRIECLPRPCHP